MLASGKSLLIAGSGERVMLRIVAENADMWNCDGSPEVASRKNRVLDEWCLRVGRDPAQIERTVILFGDQPASWREYVAGGFHHLIVNVDAPFDLDAAQRLLEAAAVDHSPAP